MAAIQQPDWQAIARERFPGFSIRGLGPFAVANSSTMTVELFSHLLLANAAGGKVIELHPPKSKPAFRKIHIRD
jgi:hypothetical protein